jgi:nucleotide-binding universal stress UspA family protein
MPGIFVGVDGSGQSDRALGWAAREAALRQVPLTVLTVHKVVIGCLGGSVDCAADGAATKRARSLARERTDKVLDSLQVASPQVTIQSVSGSPAEDLLKTAGDADLLVIGSRGAGGFARLLMGSVSARSPSTLSARSSSSPQRATDSSKLRTARQDGRHDGACAGISMRAGRLPRCASSPSGS